MNIGERKMEIIRSLDLKKLSQSWGVSIELFKNEKKNTELGLFRCDPDKTMDIHKHEHGDEIIYVINGTGNFQVKTKEIELSEGSALFIPKKVEHKAFNKGKKEYWCFYVISSLK